MARIKNRVWQWLAGIIAYTCSAFALAAPTWASIEKVTEGKPDEAAGLKNLAPLIEEFSDSAVFDTFLHSAESSRTHLAMEGRQQVAKVRQQVAKVRQQVAKVRQQMFYKEQPAPSFKEPPATGKKSGQAPQQQVTYVVAKR